MNNLKYIGTGTGRCGTVCIAKFLTHIGIPCGHESIFDFASEDIIKERIENPNSRTYSECSVHLFANKEEKWIDPGKIIADSSYLAVPYFHLVPNIPIIHIVRNPIDVISSYVLDFNYFQLKTPNKENPYNKNGYEEIIYKFLPNLSSMENQITRAVWFYVKWNNQIEKEKEKRKYLRINIENFDKNELCDFVQGNTLLAKTYKDDKNINSHKGEKTLTINDIPKGHFKDIIYKKMIDYGYINNLTI